MFKKDPYYHGCPSLGRGLPIEIGFGKNHIQIYNDWFLDTILQEDPLIENESPEDDIIDDLDGCFASDMLLYGKKIKAFDFDELTTSALTSQEYDIFYRHYVNGETFRALGLVYNCSYKTVFTIYKATLQKLKVAILKMNDLPT